jgi:hypothetical protein
VDVWGCSGILETNSGPVSEPFRHISVARRDIWEPRERLAKIEIAVSSFEARGRPPLIAVQSSFADVA